MTRATEEEYEEWEETADEMERAKKYLEDANKDTKCFTIVEQNILELAIAHLQEDPDSAEEISDAMGISPGDAMKIFNEATIRKISLLRCGRPAKETEIKK